MGRDRFFKPLPVPSNPKPLCTAVMAMAVTASSSSPSSLHRIPVPSYRLAAPRGRRSASFRTPSFSLSHERPFWAPRIRAVVRARPADSSLYAASLDAEEEEEIEEQDVEAVNIAEDVSQVFHFTSPRRYVRTRCCSFVLCGTEFLCPPQSAWCDDFVLVFTLIHISLLEIIGSFDN